MPNLELNDDWVLSCPIVTTNSAGNVEPVPAGDVFSVAVTHADGSDGSASLGAVIGTMADGTTPAVVLTPLVQASPSLNVTVSDSAGLAQFVQIVDIVPDVTPTNIMLDIADATHVSQPTPTTPGP